MSIIHRANAQVLRNSFSNVYSENSRDRSYQSDYYGRYPPNSFKNRFKNWDNSQFVPTGIDSVYGDSRCLGDRNQNLEPIGTVSVELRLGTVVGTYISLCDGPGVPEYDRPNFKFNHLPKIYRNITAFLGIPYAVPPTDSLRFRPPQVHPTFNMKRTLQFKSACPQPSQYTGLKTGIIDTNEDCLYLNIFSPSVKRQTEKYAVMIYIHGGDWDHGSSSIFPAQMLAASQEVIVVTFNYRLGPLGFYATGENSSAGNYGLLDQAMAIEWVYDNIDAFNGNNEKITLFGPGVGAASAGIHALSSRLGKKIRGVIAQSGSAVADWAATADNYTIFNNSLEYAQLFNCHFQSSYRTVDCLRGEALSRFDATHFKPHVGWFSWTPVVDFCNREEGKRILPDIPENLIKNSYENLHDDFAYMGGVTRDEAITMILQDPEVKKTGYKITHQYFKKKISEFSSVFNYTLDIPALTKALEFMYMPRESDLGNETLLREGYANMLSDSYVIAPNDKIMKLLLHRSVRTYMYVLNSSLEGLQTIQGHEYNTFKNVVPHDLEYYLITGAPFMDPKLYPSGLNLQDAKWTEADRNISQFFMTAWANFAKFGNPTPAALFNIFWEPSDLNKMQYLSINTTNFTSVMMSSYRQKESQFWNSFLPTLMKKGRNKFSTTYCRPVYEPWEDQKNVYAASLWGVLGGVTLFGILTFIFCCLYCKVKSKHVVSSEDIPDAISVTPSSIDTLLNMKRIEAGNRYYADRLSTEQKHTQV
ncbi:cholinesterase-like [Uloborus diversus]|uniref:cholinesterase-like n=1 Tax=Uloborus diversus TaxID=327109 RepID=UPI002409B913|nr:cholinesterase-like [Uloborus diversus]